jgi:hypothetical protein
VKGRIERVKPSTADGRARKTELKKLIRDSRTSRADRERYRMELDEVSPPINPAERFEPKILSGSLTKNEDSTDGESILSETPAANPLTEKTGTPVLQAEARGSGTPIEWARRLDAAKQALASQLAAKKLRIDDTLCAVAEEHAKFGYEVWTGRTDWEDLPREGRAKIVTCQLKFWRREPVVDVPTWAEGAWFYFMQLSAVEKLKERAAIEQSKKLTTPESRAKIFEQLKIAERMVTPMPEKYWKEEPLTNPPAVEAEPFERVEPVQKPTFALQSAPVVPVAPEPTPIQAAGIDLASRAALILGTDGWLTKLSQHSDEMRTRILAALGDELLRAGAVSGDFAAKLYNASRPRAVSAYPERKF